MTRKNLLLGSAVLFVISSIGMVAIDSFLRNDITPYGIVSFELIRQIEAAESAMAAWSPVDETAAGVSLGLDYLYIVLYTIIISLLLLYTSEKVDNVSPGFGGFLKSLAYLFPVVGILDAIENYCLIMVLLGYREETWPLSAYYCALAKFAGFAVALFLIIAGQVYARVKAP